MSKIQWTQRTWNPIVGCSKISEGCDNCYAEKTATRLSCIESTKQYAQVVTDKKWNGKTALVESALEIPWKRKKPTTYFVGSMTDLFHESTPFEWLDRVFAVMALCPQHKFILLTKRPERMREYLEGFGVADRTTHNANLIIINSNKDYTTAECNLIEYRDGVPLPNVILGVTAESQEQANKRVPILLDTPAAARFVSVEPMLEAIDLNNLTIPFGMGETEQFNALTGELLDGFGTHNPVGLDWVICGGESGPNARPMHPDWARGLRDQCKSAGVPFFFKQWGEWRVVERRKATHMIRPSGHVMDYVTPVETTDDFWKPIARIGKKKAGNILDGKVWDQLPEILEGENV